VADFDKVRTKEAAPAVLGKKLTHSTDVPAAGSAPGMKMEMDVASAWDVAAVPALEAAAVPA